MDQSKISLPRLLLKATLFFFAINLIFASLNLASALGELSLYNWLLPGRERLPYGDDPQRSYNLNLFSLEAMFASHELTDGVKPEHEFRVLVIGDSSIWGFLLENKDTLTAALNSAGLQSEDGREAVFYNLGHPTISLTKDLMILDEAMQYQPDLIIWPVTLEAFPLNKQLSSPLVQNNPQRVRSLIAEYNLPLDAGSSEFADDDFQHRTILGQRRNLADNIRLQLYGFAWASTGIDIFIPETFELRATDLEASEEYYDLGPELEESELAIEVLTAGVQRAGEVPVLIVNEPVFVSEGANSDLRYNSFYPRWAYDSYLAILADAAVQGGWHYADLWQAASNSEFTNTPIHLSAQGTLEFSEALIAVLHEQFNLQP
jgi:hypothetical protein